jgi:hypothetical protein
MEQLRIKLMTIGVLSAPSEEAPCDLESRQTQLHPLIISFAQFKS